jgi:hypothetical protein
MCSTGGGAISEIADAIEQVAAQAREETPAQDLTGLTTRVADIWLMVTALDPDLARRRRRYDGTAE